MQTLSGNEAYDLWEKYWNETNSTWYKVEVLQDYSKEDENSSLFEWLKGNKSKSIEILRTQIAKEAWVKDIASTTFNKTRIHIVDKQYTQYLEWELECYRNINIPLCNESIYLAESSELTNLIIPTGDFVIFDKKRVVQNHYKNGKVYKMDFYDDSTTAQLYLNLWASILTKVTPVL